MDTLTGGTTVKTNSKPKKTKPEIQLQYVEETDELLIKQLKAEIKELKKKSERAIKVLQERCNKCSIHGVSSYCSKCQVSKASGLLTEGTTPSEE